MARIWTSAQQSALDTRDRTLLVSAAAGSGKTAVLTERIIRSLTDPQSPIDLSRILVVTFTIAATGELRTRIAAALSAALAKDPTNAHLNRQLMLLGSAHISTIDAFYLKLVKNNFQAAGFPPTFRMADDSELLSLRRELMNDAVDQMYENEPDFSLLSDIFCDLRTETKLTEYLLDIAERLDKLPDSIDALLTSAEALEQHKSAPLQTPWGEAYLAELGVLARQGVALFSHALPLFGEPTSDNKVGQKYTPAYRELYERTTALLAAVEAADYDAIRDLSQRPLQIALGGGRGIVLTDEQEDAKLLCEDYRKSVWPQKVAVLGVFNSAENHISAVESAEALRLLHKTLSLYNESYRAAKMQRGLAEFSDVSRAAYRLLVDSEGKPTALAREISANYDAIYIDEYQDTDAMQDATFRAISTPRNRFMVGDIKQSIYGFRGAQPAIFAGYRKAFPLLEESDSEAASIFMSDCFRCDSNIIAFSNAVSGFLFSNNAEGIGYTPQDDLNFSKAPPSDPDYTPPACAVKVIARPTKSDDAEESDGLAEARMTAHEIHKLLQDGKRSDGQPIQPGDIAVLMRSTKHAAPIAKALAAYGIPANDTSKKNFFESPEVLCMYSLLAAIDNPFRDVPLAAALRSPFFCFTLEDLVALRGCGDRSLSLYECLDAFVPSEDKPALAAKVRYARERLALFRRKARTLPVDKLLRYLYRETGVLSFNGYEQNTAGDKKSRRANLRRLYEYARGFEQNGFKGLYQFVNYIDDVMANGTKVDANEGEKNAVALITIHHSKGLEYPVCFLVGTGSRFSTEDTK
ncbi:MAG: UvrD-helicase domain-containing protein, partial [Clostridia bacterium]|nr:UvrD-helicase domain-containing protein [Clostridia bacterium]